MAPKDVRAAFITSLLLLVGGSLVEAEHLLVSRFFSDQFPSTGPFIFFFSFYWIPLAFITAWCGAAGGYLAIRDGHLNSAYLTAFGVLLLPAIKIDGVLLGSSALNLSFEFGFASFKIGLNFLGIGYLLWLHGARKIPRPALPLPQSSA
jgi:hypothetical protein